MIRELTPEQKATLTDREFAAWQYQLQGSYDDKPVMILSRDLYHRRLVGTASTLTFFDGNLSDPTVTNVASNQLPATESFTILDVGLKMLCIGAVATPNALIQACLNFLSVGQLTVTVANKAPVVEIPTSRFVPTIALAADNAALTASDIGEYFVEGIYKLAIPQVIGEKVSFSAKFVAGVAPAAILNAAGVQMALNLGGITVRGR